MNRVARLARLPVSLARLFLCLPFRATLILPRLVQLSGGVVSLLYRLL